MHLFRAVGRNVPDDRRLVALSDVRDLSVVRDGARAIRALPQLEHVLDACLDALRAARAADPTDARSDWNRVLLYVWPVVDLPLAEFDSWSAGWRRAPRGWGWSRSSCSSGWRRRSSGAGTRAAGAAPAAVPAAGRGATVRVTDPPADPLRELTPTRRR